MPEQEGVRADIEQVNEHISRTRSRIVQSPDRIRNNIKTMTTAAAEDKRAVSMRETKIRDLQTKIAALQTIENVCGDFCPGPGRLNTNCLGRT